MNLRELYEPDGVRLTTKMIGAPGSGKSYFARNTLMTFMGQNKDPMLHVVYVCPKHEMDLGKNSVTTLEKLPKHMRKNRMHVLYPNPEAVDFEVDEIIATVFDIRASNPEFKCCLLVDDVQIFLSARRETSPQFKRLALVGRSMNIRFVAISHGFVFSKALEGSTSYIVHFRTLMTPIHVKDAMNRYGYDPQPYIKPLNEVPYSHVMFDVTKGSTRLMKPINLTSLRKRAPSAR